MEKVDRSRRRLLQASASLFGGSAALAFTSSARAWEEVPMQPGSAAAQDYAQRCGGLGEHAALTRKLQLALAQNPSLASLSEVCPICGCPVIVSR
jgi:hypothetical protein